MLNFGIDKTITASKEVEAFAETAIGFRSESLFDEGEREVFKVVEYETFQLGNSDIAKTVLAHYSEKLSDEERTLFKKVIANDTEVAEEEITDFCSCIKQLVSEQVKCEDPECVWVCSSKEDIENSYLSHLQVEEREAYLDAICLYVFKQKSKVFLLSDLAHEGFLIGYNPKDLKIYRKGESQYEINLQLVYRV